MKFPFLNKFGEIEEHELFQAQSYTEIPRPVELVLPMEDSASYVKEVFKRKDMAYKFNNKYCRVSVYVSEEFGLFPVEHENRETYIHVTLHQMAPYLFTYGERYTP